MEVRELLRQIDDLPVEGQLAVYAHLASKLKRREQIFATLEKIRGKGQGLWNMDAQEYVKQLRSNDRF